MKDKVIVSIPAGEKKITSYSLYCEGCIADAPVISDDGNFICFSFFSDSIIVLFYKFTDSKLRRGYVVCKWNEKSHGQPIILPGLDVKLELIYSACGKHRVDDLKRAVYILSNKKSSIKCFQYGRNFWYRVGYLIHNARASKFNLKYLVDKMINQMNFLEEIYEYN